MKKHVLMLICAKQGAGVEYGTRNSFDEYLCHQTFTTLIALALIMETMVNVVTFLEGNFLQINVFL